MAQQELWRGSWLTSTLSVCSTKGLEQEPDPLLGFVDPLLEQARARNVAVLVAKIVHGAHAGDQCAIVLAQLRQRLVRLDEGSLTAAESS